MQNILHISDLHVSSIPTAGMNERNLSILLTSLIEDINTLPKKVDTIFFTGDIANSGSEAEYQIFLKYFLTPLLYALNLDTTRVIIAPGNHDTNRKEWKKSDQMVRAGLVSNPLPASIDEIIQEKIEDMNCTWYSNYTNMRNELDSSKKKVLLANKFFSAYEIDGVGVGCINSAWLSNENDKECIFVSGWQFSEIIKALKPYNQRAILMHHPLTWLHPEDSRSLMDNLHSSKISCLFYGHMHEFWMTKESLFSEDSVLKLQAGKLDTSKGDKYCGYSLIALHEQNTFESGDIYFRRHDPNNSKFRPWTERMDNGKSTYSLTNVLPFDPKQFSARCNEICSEIEFDLLCNTGLPSDQRKKLSDIFILPALVIENEEGISEESFDSKPKANTSAQYRSLNSISDSSESLIVLGGENSGKSTLAKRLSLHYLTNQSAQNLENVVFYLDLKGKTLKNTKRVSSELLSFYLQGGSEPSFQIKLEHKLNSNSAVIILDSLEGLDSPSLKIIFEYISTSPARFVIFGQLSARPVLREMTTRLGSKNIFRYLNVKSLKRNHLKELISKWAPSSSSTQTSKVASSALKVVSSAGMANNPFVFTMLLSIRERKAAAFRTYMHEADLVENFIEIIMQKHVIPSGNVPQYKDVLLFLGYVANHMQDNTNYHISDNELTQMALDFNRLVFQNFNVVTYIDPILSSGIMRKVGDQYRFSQVCFFNYALAIWISKQDIDYIKLDKRLDFIRFDKVVEYVSAIKNDSRLLDYLADKMKNAWEQLKAMENFSDINDAECEIMKCVGHDIIDMVKQDDLETSFNKIRYSEKEHDEKLDQAAPLNDKPLTEVKVMSNDINPIVEFHEALSLYARAFRSAEHILDSTVTLSHFKNIFQHYMNSIAFNVRDFDVNARAIIIGRIKSILEYEKIEEGKRGEIENQVNAFINFVIAAIPNWGVAMMSSDFFNQRQQLRIKTYRDKTENNLEKILLTYCLCELDDIHVLGELKGLKYEKRHESSSLILKLIELIFLNFSIPDAEKENLKKFAQKMIKDRKTSQLFKSYTAVSQKMAMKVGVTENNNPLPN